MNITIADVERLSDIFALKYIFICVLQQAHKYEVQVRTALAYLENSIINSEI